MAEMTDIASISNSWPILMRAGRSVLPHRNKPIAAVWTTSGRPAPSNCAPASTATIESALKARISGAIRTALSPRFVPDAILQVPEIPRTLSGKKQELPIKKLLLGQPSEKVVNRDAMANPQCLEWYVEFARRRAA